MVTFRGKGLGTKPAITHQAKLHTITAISYFYPLGRVVPYEYMEIEKSIILLLIPLRDCSRKLLLLEECPSFADMDESYYNPQGHYYSYSRKVPEA